VLHCGMSFHKLGRRCEQPWARHTKEGFKSEQIPLMVTLGMAESVAGRLRASWQADWATNAKIRQTLILKVGVLG
jgi:hypothetical protein